MDNDINNTELDEKPNNPKVKVISIVSIFSLGILVIAAGVIWKHTSKKAIPYTAPAKVVSCLTAAQASHEIGQTGCVTFTGYALTTPNGQMYLVDGKSGSLNSFSVWLPKGESLGPVVLKQYSATSISVTGAITQYNNEPQIEVTSASQIQKAQ